jgi:hypothetical protein
MKAMISAALAMIVLTVGSYVVLTGMGLSSAQQGTSTQNVRLD